MGLITRLKSLLGLGDERSKARQRDSGVTIEREPTETKEQPDAESERTIKGTESEVATEESDTSVSTEESDTGVSTEDIVDEDEPTDHIEEAEPDTAAEPAEATGPTAEAGQPAQTEATEPEPEPDEVEDSQAEDPDTSAEPAEESETTEPDVTDESEATEEPETADEHEATAEADVKAGRPLEDVKGIGPAYAERLRNAGVDDAAQLATADSEELAGKTDLSAKRIEGWIDRAKSM